MATLLAETYVSVSVDKTKLNSDLNQVQAKLASTAAMSSKAFLTAFEQVSRNISMVANRIASGIKTIMAPILGVLAYAGKQFFGKVSRTPTGEKVSGTIYYKEAVVFKEKFQVLMAGINYSLAKIFNEMTKVKIGGKDFLEWMQTLGDWLKTINKQDIENFVNSMKKLVVVFASLKLISWISSLAGGIAGLTAGAMKFNRIVNGSSLFSAGASWKPGVTSGIGSAIGSFLGLKGLGKGFNRTDKVFLTSSGKKLDDVNLTFFRQIVTPMERWREYGNKFQSTFGKMLRFINDIVKGIFNSKLIGGSFAKLGLIVFAVVTAFEFLKGTMYDFKEAFGMVFGWLSQFSKWIGGIVNKLRKMFDAFDVFIDAILNLPKMVAAGIYEIFQRWAVVAANVMNYITNPLNPSLLVGKEKEKFIDERMQKLWERMGYKTDLIKKPGELSMTSDVPGQFIPITEGAKYAQEKAHSLFELIKENDKEKIELQKAQLEETKKVSMNQNQLIDYQKQLLGLATS